MSNLSRQSARRWSTARASSQTRRGLASVGLLHAVLTLAAGAPTASAAAREDGLATAGCTGCHNGGREAKVTITPSTTNIAVGQKISLTIAIEAINGTRGGLYFTSTSGVGRLTVTDASTKVSGSNGIVHTSPKSASGSSVSFTVDWTAPAQPGGVELNAYAISANGDGRSSGDGAGVGFLSLAFGCTGTKYYGDRDGDGDGAPDGEYRMACSKPMYFAPSATDCDDNDERVHAGASELCNGRDDDCDGMVDEGLTVSVYCEDKDGDGHGVQSAVTKMACGTSKGFGLCDDDCNDADPTVYPGAQELCNYKDENCNTRIDEEAKQSCGVGWCRRYSDSCSASLCTPGEPRAEDCNAFDDDCDGVVDNGANLCGSGKACVDGYCIVGGASDGGSGGGDAGVPPATDGGAAPRAPQQSDDGLGASNGGCRLHGSQADSAWPLLLLCLALRRRHRKTG